MTDHLLRRIGLAGLLIALSLPPALAQAPAPQGAEPSMTCRLFPLACPGPTPPPPPPLIGTPEEQTDAAPPPAPPSVKHRHGARKHVPKHKAT